MPWCQCSIPVPRCHRNLIVEVNALTPDTMSFPDADTAVDRYRESGVSRSPLNASFPGRITNV